MTSTPSIASKKPTKNKSNLSSKEDIIHHSLLVTNDSWSRFFVAILLSLIGLTILTVMITLFFAEHNCSRFSKNTSVEIGNVMIGYICPIFDVGIDPDEPEYKGFVIEDMSSTMIY